MGICYWVLAPDHKTAFELNKGFGELDLSTLTRKAITKSVYDVWCGSWEESGAPDDGDWVLDAERGMWLMRTWWFPEGEEGRREGGLPSDAWVLAQAKEAREYAARVAAWLWSFCETYGPNLKLVNDCCDDIPWDTYEHKDAQGWKQVGSRFDADQDKFPRRLPGY